MATHVFADLAGGAVSFVPSQDQLLFGAAYAAASIRFTQAGADLLVSSGAQTLRLLDVALVGSGLSGANFVFEDGSVLLLDGPGNAMRSGTGGADWIAIDRGGTDTVDAGAGDDRIVAGAMLDAADRLDGGAGTNDVLAVGGSLTVALGPFTLRGVETIEVGAGFVSLSLDDATVATATPRPGALFTVDASGQGTNARLTVMGGAVVSGGMALLGGAGDDSLVGGLLADRLAGGAGDDTIHGGAGDDTIEGGGGQDVLAGGPGEDLFVFTARDVPQSTPASPDLILDFEGAGLPGGDRIALPGQVAIGRVLAFHVAPADFAFVGYAESGQQIPSSRIGDGIVDVLWRVVAGAEWRFEIWVDLDDDGRFGTTDLFIRVAVPAGDPATTLTAADFAVGFGAQFGGPGDDTMAGLGGTDDLFFGGEGDDSLLGGDGVDELHGGPGDDTLRGGDLADLLHGGPGSDWLEGGDGWDTLFAADPYAPETESPADRNRLIGGAGPDLLFGGLGRDTLEGGTEDDVLWGDAGDDSLLGGQGEDVLFGGAGDDVLDGGEGDDTLTGGPGRDTMTGGPGADLFLYDLMAPGQKGASAAAPDWITDFDPGAGDRIALGTTTGMAMGGFGLGPLVWRGAIAPRDLAAGLPLGLALPGGGIGTGYYQAFWVPALAGGADAGGWFVVDLDQDHLLGAEDFVLRLGGVGAPVSLDQTAFAAGSFRVLVGTPAADTLSAGAGGQEVFGLGGHDRLLGSAGPDRLLGGEGNDTLLGGAGDDALWGGGGDDRLEGGDGDDALYAEGPGTAEVDGFLGRNTLLGGAGRDSLWGADGRDWLDGGADADFLYGGAGADTLLGGAGDDTIEAADGADSIEGGPGADRIDAGSGNDTVVLDPDDPWVDGGDDWDWLIVGLPVVMDLADADDQLTGGGILRGFEAVNAAAATGAVIIAGSAGANHLIGGAHADILSGGAGNDTLVGGAGADSLFGGEGDDLIIPGTGADYMEGGAGRDTVSYADAPNRVSIALAGIGLGSFFAAGDTLIGFEGAIGSNFADTITGSAQPDWIDGGAGFDFLSGFGGNDTLIGGAGFNTLRGGGGDDSLVGGPSADTIEGGDGNDTIIAGGGADHMWGGNGNDTYFINLSNQVIYEPVNGGSDTVHSTTSWWLRPQIEWFIIQPGAGDLFAIGTAGDERLVGNEGDNLLVGGDGNDTIWGGAGIDRIQGQGGHDILFGDDGNDIILGGDGNDWIEGGAGNDNIQGDAGNDTILGGAGNDILRGGAGHDWLDGGAGADVMYGGTGNDTFTAAEAGDVVIENAGEGWDVLIHRGGGTVFLPDHVEELHLDGPASGVGNAASNRIVGSFRAETLLGGDGNDTLAGGGGNDILFGQAGRDSFLFAPGSGLDVVADFEPGMDRILLQGFGFANFQALMAATRDEAGGVILDLAAGDSVLLAGVAKAALASGDFVFLA
jgi:Ca2+-binding RTX toxin-like protein